MGYKRCEDTAGGDLKNGGRFYLARHLSNEDPPWTPVWCGSEGGQWTGSGQEGEADGGDGLGAKGTGRCSRRDWAAVGGGGGGVEARGSTLALGVPGSLSLQGQTKR